MWPFKFRAEPKTVCHIHELSAVELEKYIIETTEVPNKHNGVTRDWVMRVHRRFTCFDERAKAGIWIVYSERWWVELAKYGNYSPRRLRVE